MTYRSSKAVSERSQTCGWLTLSKVAVGARRSDYFAHCCCPTGVFTVDTWNPRQLSGNHSKVSQQDRLRINVLQNGGSFIFCFCTAMFFKEWELKPDGESRFLCLIKVAHCVTTRCSLHDQAAQAVEVDHSPSGLSRLTGQVRPARSGKRVHATPQHIKRDSCASAATRMFNISLQHLRSHLEVELFTLAPPPLAAWPRAASVARSGSSFGGQCFTF